MPVPRIVNNSSSEEIYLEDSADESAGQRDASDEEDLRSLLHSVSALRVSSDGLVFHEDPDGNQSWARRRQRSNGSLSRSEACDAADAGVPVSAQLLVVPAEDCESCSPNNGTPAPDQVSTQCPSVETSNRSDDGTVGQRSRQEVAATPRRQQVQACAKAPASWQHRSGSPNQAPHCRQKALLHTGGRLRHTIGGTTPSSRQKDATKRDGARSSAEAGTLMGRRIVSSCQLSGSKRSAGSSATRVRSTRSMSARAQEVQALQAEVALQEAQIQKLLNARPGEETSDEVAFEAARLWRGLETVRAEIASLRETLTIEDFAAEPEPEVQSWQFQSGGHPASTAVPHLASSQESRSSQAVRSPRSSFRHRPPGMLNGPAAVATSLGTASSSRRSHSAEKAVIQPTSGRAGGNPCVCVNRPGSPGASRGGSLRAPAGSGSTAGGSCRVPLARSRPAAAAGSADGASGVKRNSSRNGDRSLSPVSIPVRVETIRPVAPSPPNGYACSAYTLSSKPRHLPERQLSCPSPAPFQRREILEAPVSPARSPGRLLRAQDAAALPASPGKVLSRQMRRGAEAPSIFWHI
eukprot:TRINITY_DN60861_c0_g1_i1.p1 TRINITY_DN60861_c0_g1~~TRINITY_DN60861_c0_g1_i1.p1  ORF type:complete len:579 (+),score=90.34 TRINITY_DN60861_c0_g1_i1:73-1809(+)